jgi:hypothetical protein
MAAWAGLIFFDRKTNVENIIWNKENLFLGGEKGRWITCNCIFSRKS